MVQTLNNLLLDVPVVKVYGDIQISVSDIVYDTRKSIPKGSLYVALRGTKIDGHDMIDTAIDKGAQAILCEEFPQKIRDHVTYVQVANTHHSIALVSEAYFDYPSKKLQLIGVTGTNGKTTIATLLYSFFRDVGEHAVLLSTVENKIDDEIFEASQTTPDPYDISRMLALAVERGATYAVMEVSSHAIHQLRVSGLRFAGGLFTNVTHDHLDYHETFQEYTRVKKMFFDFLSNQAFAVTNRDDSEGEWMLKNTVAKKYSYSINDEADFKGELVSSTLEGIEMKINNAPVHVRLIGKFNAYNILAVYSALILLEFDETLIREKLSLLSPPPGRLEFVKSTTGVYGVVDYAHTPDAVENVLKTLREVTKENIITVIGCGGDRDLLKRPLIGALAHDMSNHTIFTSDNPRSEDPQKILDDMTDILSDDGTWEIVVDRYEAIRQAVALAQPGDVVLLAGKGHEEYQEISGVKHHFSDREQLDTVFSMV